MRTIGVVTVGRSDYSHYVPILRRIQRHEGLALRLLVSGMHLAPEFGLTVRAIEADGFPISERIPMLLSSDEPAGVAASMGLGTIGFAQVFLRSRPDLLLVLGDRFEMHAAVVAAVPCQIPVAHIAGGELTEGAFDDALRHSMTKLSHLHFPTTEAHGQRLLQMGEEPWRVTVAGAPSLDLLGQMRRAGREELAARLGMPLEPAPLLVTFHPVTREPERADWQIGELLAAVEASGLPAVFTGPNADPQGRAIASRLEQFVAAHPQARLVPNLGLEGYFGLLGVAAAMVGNSSSGLIEAPSFELPVVNIGARQQGRVRAENVIDVGADRQSILRGIQQATAPPFRAGLRGLRNPYGDGHATERIVRRLAEVPLDARLLQKRFVDAHAPLALGAEASA